MLAAAASAPVAAATPPDATATASDTTGTPPSSADPVESAPPTHTIGGTLAGLATHTKLVLLDNGGDALTLTANGPFSFATPLAFNTDYAVTVGTQPSWQNCSVAQGNGTATANVTSVSVSCAEAQARVSTFAGTGTAGSNDGSGTAASFNDLLAVTVDAGGNLYLADGGNNMIRKISPAGVVGTVAGSPTAGYADATGAAARFSGPAGVAVDAGGNIYVADYGNNMIRKISPAGEVSTWAGSTSPGLVDGIGTNARFNRPWSLDIDAGGNLYVLDGGNNVIRKITPAGMVTTLAGSGTQGSTDGQGTAASFGPPSSLRVGPDGNIYVADGNHLIRKITPDGIVTTLAGSTTPGFVDGTLAAARFKEPWGLAVDTSGNVYVADAGNNAIRKITPDGVVTTIAGSSTPGSADGIGAAAQFSDLVDVTADRDGDLYVVSSYLVRKITPVR
ncbi:hypothetical protein GCM10023165_52680 [Variovorax defluvii]|uniref:NHL repeat-containing protein n=2 Tax=Variovorax defluvii TaxID=913761 RepID=A0ABP8IFY2_9BURK